MLQGLLGDRRNAAAVGAMWVYVDTLEDPDGTTWVLFTWPMLAVLIVITVLLGVVIGGLIGRAKAR